MTDEKQIVQGPHLPDYLIPWHKLILIAEKSTREHGIYRGLKKHVNQEKLMQSPIQDIQFVDLKLSDKSGIHSVANDKQKLFKKVSIHNKNINNKHQNKIKAINTRLFHDYQEKFGFNTQNSINERTIAQKRFCVSNPIMRRRISPQFMLNLHQDASRTNSKSKFPIFKKQNMKRILNQQMYIPEIQVRRRLENFKRRIIKISISERNTINSGSEKMQI